jgi:hypothetical protein
MSEQVDDEGNCWLEICMAQRNIDKLIRDSGGSVEFHPDVVADTTVNNVAGAAQAS